MPATGSSASSGNGRQEPADPLCRRRAGRRFFAVYFNAGECCNSGSRVLVDSSIAEEVQQDIVTRSRRVPVGDSLDPDTLVGAIASDEQLATLERYVAERAGGTAPSCSSVEPAARPVSARFYEPTVFAGVQEDMSIAREEIFGPVLLSVLTFDTVR